MDQHSKHSLSLVLGAFLLVSACGSDDGDDGGGTGGSAGSATAGQGGSSTAGTGGSSSGKGGTSSGKGGSSGSGTGGSSSGTGGTTAGAGGSTGGTAGTPTGGTGGIPTDPDCPATVTQGASCDENGMVCDGSAGQCLCIGIGADPTWQCLSGAGGDGGIDWGQAGTFGDFGEGGTFSFP